jgi:uncharacterized membrane protein YphA (DoxX/SURF4 family)
MLLRTPYFDKLDRKLIRWMSRYGIKLLRISIGIVFFWFGFLKFFPGVSPAEELAVNTIQVISFNLLEPRAILTILAIWESLIGLGLISGVLLRETLLLLFLQMIGTLFPIFIFPGEVFTRIPYALTLEGQYIIKNLALMSAGLVIGATVRGGKILPEPDNS